MSTKFFHCVFKDSSSFLKVESLTEAERFKLVIVRYLGLFCVPQSSGSADVMLAAGDATSRRNVSRLLQQLLDAESWNVDRVFDLQLVTTPFLMSVV